MEMKMKHKRLVVIAGWVVTITLTLMLPLDWSSVNRATRERAAADRVEWACGIIWRDPLTNVWLHYAQCLTNLWCGNVPEKRCHTVEKRRIVQNQRTNYVCLELFSSVHLVFHLLPRAWLVVEDNILPMTFMPCSANLLETSLVSELLLTRPVTKRQGQWGQN